MRIQRWIAVLAIATFAVAACGDSDSDSSDDVGSETESTSAPASNDDGGAETGDEAEPDATQAPAAAPQGAYRVPARETQAACWTSCCCNKYPRRPPNREIP